MGWWFRKPEVDVTSPDWQAPPPASTKGEAGLGRKCKPYINGLSGCRAANSSDHAAACKNLELKVVTCYAEVMCPEAADEHRRCYTSLYKTGVYKGAGHCLPYEEAMKQCLKRKKLFPV